MDHKIAIVAGASKGIGWAISQQLIQEKWKIVGIGREFNKPLPDLFIPYPLDLSDSRNLPEALKQLKSAYPKVDAIICSAGRGSFGSLEEFSFDEIRSLMELNFLSHVFLIKTFLPTFKKCGFGEIVLIGSESALQGKRMGSLYCASKFALRGFAQALREECATSNIRVTLINPGMVQTDFFNRLSFEPGDSPLEHLTPEDIAEAVSLVLNARQGTVFDEINLSPQKKRILFKKNNSIA